MSVRESTKMLVAPFHSAIANACDGVFKGKYKRLLITVPAGYTKTEMITLGIAARGLAVNPRSRSMMVSYSDGLVKDNSRKIKQLIESEEYSDLWGVTLLKDARRAGLWVTSESGQLFSASSAGQITGFRAGTMENADFHSGNDYLFTGAFIGDDLIKPDDAFSPALRKKINRRLTNTFKSRLMHDKIPMIMVMQRIHTDDPANYVLTGGMGEKWHHLYLPLIIDNDLPYPKEWTHGIPIDHGLKNGMLWEQKHNEASLPALKADKYTFYSQYMQRPRVSEGALFREEWFQYYTKLPHNLEQVHIYADTAQKKGESNDYTVFEVWGLVREPNRDDDYIILLDLKRGKMDASELLEEAILFWRRHIRKHGFNRAGATSFRIEDKSSGTGLIQQLQKNGKVNVVPIPRGSQSKGSRFMDCVPSVKMGKVRLPRGDILEYSGGVLTDSSFVPAFVHEACNVTANDSHDFDDQIDPMSDAVHHLLIENAASIYYSI